MSYFKGTCARSNNQEKQTVIALDKPKKKHTYISSMPRYSYLLVAFILVILSIGPFQTREWFFCTSKNSKKNVSLPPCYIPHQNISDLSLFTSKQDMQFRKTLTDSKDLLHFSFNNGKASQVIRKCTFFCIPSRKWIALQRAFNSQDERLQQ